MRINNDGTYGYCRWIDQTVHDSQSHIGITSPRQYFQQCMAPLRQKLLAGEAPAACGPCYRMDSHGKVSGRQRQLLKTGVRSEYFVKSMQSSPWIEEFASNGTTDLMPQDWQIDLGNFCNSACLFCHPQYSSRLATEFKRLGWIDSMPPPNWAEDPRLMERFLEALGQSPVIRYLHFIGGETVITPAFRTILRHLIDLGLNRFITIGFTTNLTVWDDEVADLLKQFDRVNLGVSIECVNRINDYARWPSQIDHVMATLERWLALARSQEWYVQMRVTPTLLTVRHLVTVYHYAMTNGLAVESCNFLERPKHLRPSVLPREYRAEIIAELERWIGNQHDHVSQVVINTRHPDLAKTQVLQDATSYVRYLKNEPDESHRLPDLVSYLKTMDQSRGISVIDYLPEYENLFRSAGY